MDKLFSSRNIAWHLVDISWPNGSLRERALLPPSPVRQRIPPSRRRAVLVAPAALHAVAAHAHPAVVVAAALRIVHLRVRSFVRSFDPLDYQNRSIVRPSVPPSSLPPSVSVRMLARPPLSDRGAGEGSIGIAAAAVLLAHVGPTTHPHIPAGLMYPLAILLLSLLNIYITNCFALHLRK